MDNTYLESVYRKCLNNTATPEERRQFVEWIKTPKNETAAKELLLAAYYENIYEADADNQTVNGIIEAILWADKQNQSTTPTAGLKSATSSLSEFSPVHRVQFLRTTWFRVAAVLLLIAGTATFLYQIKRPQQDIVTKQPTTITPDIPPGRNKVILTLADGSTIVLDSSANGALASEGNTQIVKLDAGRLVYQGSGLKGAVGFNTIKTPNGRQFQVQLPDGSRVWMNSASTLRFPVSFSGPVRAVDVTGEVYFEVIENKKMPFVVNIAGKASVEVLGTSFNVNAHTNEENISATLLSGSVKLSAWENNEQVTISPGQQAVIKRLSQSIIVTAVDTDKIMAWKKGLFDFEGVPLKEAMRELERWYDIEVVYEGKIPDIHFFGEMERSLNLGDILKALQEAKLHFKREGERKLVVIP